MSGSTGARALGVAAAVAAACLFFVGGAALKWYIWDIAVQQAGEPDRSMLFWGIPIAFVGIFALSGGTGLAMYARRKLTASRASDGA